jgi:hypothetical protein
MVDYLSQKRFTGELSDLLTEADGYSHETAASLYVGHKEGFPSLEKNCLLVGPIGSGKTIMLKAIYSELTNSSQLQPVFVELSRWISQIAGETYTYPTETLSPRGQVVFQALTLSVIVGICSSSNAFAEENKFSEVWSLFPAIITSEPPSLRKQKLIRLIKDALLTSEPFQEYFPSAHAVADALGEDIRTNEGKKLVLLVDQIDQVSAPFFAPIASLLRRSGSYIAVLATRPCPAAPDAEILPDDIISGDSYKIAHLGRTADGEIPYSFIEEFIQALPLQEPFRNEVKERAVLIGDLMWPSLRSAISVIIRYVRLRGEGLDEDKSWYRSLVDTAKGYELLLKDGLRGWSNPNAMLKDWRNKIVKTKGTQAIGRTYFILPNTNLFGDLKGKPSQRLVRILLKTGVFLLGPSEPYTPGRIPLVCELAPLLLVNTPAVDLEHFNPKPLAITLSQESLETWTKVHGPVSQRGPKQVFVSYKMEGGEKTPLIKILRTKFRETIGILTGEGVASPRYSIDIVEKIGAADIVISDLSVPRRAVFAEYGMAIGKFKPVLQCISTETAVAQLPTWVANRQYHQFEANTISPQYDVENSVSHLLNTDPDFRLCWKRDSFGHTLEVKQKDNVVFFLGASAANEIFRRLDTAARERNFDVKACDISNHGDQLEEVIKGVRGCSTMVVCFEGTNSDYLGCLAGGLFMTKGRVGPGSMLFYNMSEVDASVTKLLSSHPAAKLCGNPAQLYNTFESRLTALLTRKKKNSRTK